MSNTLLSSNSFRRKLETMNDFPINKNWIRFNNNKNNKYILLTVWEPRKKEQQLPWK